MIDTSKFVRTGIPALDDITGGGLTADRVYLLQGNPGSGKTTLAMQFLQEGAAHGEKVLYVTLAETAAELAASAASHGWDLAGIEILELIASEQELQAEHQYTMYQPSETELNVSTEAITSKVEEFKPSRVVIDSLSEVKLLAQNLLRYRRSILALKQFFIGKQCTTLLLDDRTMQQEEEKQLESIAHGVISLDQLIPEFGAERRRLRITKLRGQKYRGGYHDFTIQTGGLAIFPRLVAAEHREDHEQTQLQSGIDALDRQLGGGVEYGTSLLILGPAGSGKSSLAMQYAVAAARKGERAAMFTFDERVETITHRAVGLSHEISDYLENDLLSIRPIDPAELTPGEFAHKIRTAVNGEDASAPAKVVIIDSLNGYLNAMPEERFLTAQLHELLSYLGHKNVITILIVAQHGLLGQAMRSPVDTSYLADSVILFRFFEAMGEVKQTISVLKKRSGPHERSIREFQINKEGIQVGEKLHQFHGVLTGTPEYLGNDDKLIS